MTSLFFVVVARAHARRVRQALLGELPGGRRAGGRDVERRWRRRARWRAATTATRRRRTYTHTHARRDDVIALLVLLHVIWRFTNCKVYRAVVSFAVVVMTAAVR